MVDSKENCKFGLGVKGLSEETQREQLLDCMLDSKKERMMKYGRITCSEPTDKC